MKNNLKYDCYYNVLAKSVIYFTLIVVHNIIIFKWSVNCLMLLYKNVQCNLMLNKTIKAEKCEIEIKINYGPLVTCYAYVNEMIKFWLKK